jgi:signal transduction histidine kinase
MLESLLMFSRTGGTSLRRTRQSVLGLVERALSVVRAHPDGANVSLTLHASREDRFEAWVDGQQIERAIYNLALNGCQSPREPGTAAEVSVALTSCEDQLLVHVWDNGMGIPQNIRSTLFEPFVSEGKHKGSGLGLTLTQSIASDHGGGVSLISSEPGNTMFCIRIARNSGSTIPAEPAEAHWGGNEG